MKRKFKIIATILIFVLTLGSFQPTLPVKAVASNQYIGEIILIASNFAPKGWAFCSGQLLPIAQNTALFSLLGTTYGGDGKSTFALPNLNNSVPMGVGQGAGLSPRDLGEQGGSSAVTLLESEIPAHTHTGNFPLKLEVSGTGTLKSTNLTGTSATLLNNIFAKGVRNERIYTSNSEATTNTANTMVFNEKRTLISPTTPIGGSIPHNNMEPYLGLNYIIALQGVFPPRADTQDGDNGGSLGITGEIRMFAGNFAPIGYMMCKGQTLPISANEKLFQVIGTTYGGDGQTNFNLPDLQGRSPIGAGQGPGLSQRIIGENAGVEQVTLTTQEIPMHSHSIVPNTVNINTIGSILYASGTGNTPLPENHSLAKGTKNEKLYAGNAGAYMKAAEILMNLSVTTPDVVATMESTGGSQSHNNMMPYLGINYMICMNGIFPSQGGGLSASEPFLGEIKMFAFDFNSMIYNGFTTCASQLLPINQNQALFSLLGTNYGGNGQNNFALPDLRGRVPIGMGDIIALGERGGEERHTLTLGEMPTHVHGLNAGQVTVTGSGTLMATNAAGNTNLPGNNRLAKGFKNERIYSTLPPTIAAPNSVSVDLSFLVSPTDQSGTKIPSITSINVGRSQSHENMKPFLAITYGIALSGIYPSQN